MNWPDIFLILNAAATWAMLGVVVFVQRVHYPLFDRYGRDDFAATEAMNTSRTAPVVVPPMLVELFTSVALLVEIPAGVPSWQLWLGFALVIVCACSSAFLQVPLHSRLAAGFDAAAHRKLVLTNQVRVAIWAARGVLVAVMLAERLAASGRALSLTAGGSISRV